MIDQYSADKIPFEENRDIHGPLPEAAPGPAPAASRDEAGECCLRDMPEGARAKVRKLRGCRRTLSRLCALGITPGTEIVLNGLGSNGCRVQVRDTCVVIDCDSAESIVCASPFGAGEFRGGRRGGAGRCGRKGFRSGGDGNG